MVDPRSGAAPAGGCVPFAAGGSVLSCRGAAFAVGTSPVKVLLVEDEPRLADALRRGLTEEGHQVDVCDDGRAALEQGIALPYDVAILDWMLPGLDGLAVLRGWRQRGVRAPVIMLTARGTTAEKVQGLRVGADDYLVKPFAFEELLARLDALYRRGPGGAALDLDVGGVTLDVRRRALCAGGREVALSGREYALAVEFFAHPGDALTRSELLTRVWGSPSFGDPNVVDVYVGYLRRKIEEIGASAVQIRAVRGVGYRIAVAP